MEDSGINRTGAPPQETAAPEHAAAQSSANGANPFAQNPSQAAKQVQPARGRPVPPRRNAPQHARPRNAKKPMHGLFGKKTAPKNADAARQSGRMRTNMPRTDAANGQNAPNGANAARPDTPRRPVHTQPPSEERGVPRSRTGAQAGRKKRRRAPGGGLFFGCVAAAILTISAGITALIEAPERRAQAESLAALSQAQQEQQQAESAAAGEIPYGPLMPGEDAAYTQPTAALVALPADGRVDMKYFDDALFIGDSLTRGFQEYKSGIENAKYAAYIGVGPKQFMEGLVENIKGEQVAAMDEIRAAQAKKVYILLGTNSMATLSDEAFLKYYTDFLRCLKEELAPGTIFYLQGIPPVTAEKFESDDNFSQERIKNLNESIAKIAYENDFHYLDLYGALADENGNLRQDIASGSIHLNDRGYNVWREYLITHTVYSPDNPYLPGSPRYIRPEE